MIANPCQLRLALAAAVVLAAAPAWAQVEADVDIAVTAFAAGCIGTAPSFDDHAAQFEAAGLTSTTGVWVNEAETVVAALQGGNRCLVMITAEPSEVMPALNATLKSLLPDGVEGVTEEGTGLVFPVNGTRMTVGVAKSDQFTLIIGAPDETGAASAATGPGTGLAPDATPVSAARAKALFDAICGASLPDFADAPALLDQNGFHRPSDMGTATIYSDTENVSFNIQQGPGADHTCSMSVGSDASIDALRSAVMGEDIMQADTMGEAAIYPGSRALITSSGVQVVDGVTYTGFKLVSR